MLTRRETLRGGSAAVATIAAAGAVAAAVPAIAKSSTSRDLPALADEPLVALWREHQQQRALSRALDAQVDAFGAVGAWEAANRFEDQADEIERDMFDRLESEIADTQAKTLAGCIVQAKLLVDYTNGGHLAENQDNRLAHSLLAGLENLAGGAS